MAGAKRAAPVVSKTQHEVHTSSLEMEKVPDLVVPDLGASMNRQAEAIVVADATTLQKDYADALQFNEDVLTIMLEPSQEENPAMVIDVSVNGEAKWILVGQEQNVKRKFVEVLLRSKPIGVSTMHESGDAFRSGGGAINNRIVRTPRMRYPLSIIHDPSPKGREWMRKVYAER